MKPIGLWPGALAIAFVAAACSVNHRSTDFACDTKADCSKDRSCVDGFCVLPDDAGIAIDAPRLPDASVCPSACTSCVPAQKTCTVDCALNGGCSQAVICPAGWNCNVLCSTSNACRSGVTCPSGNTCTVTCSGFRSCQGIVCGSGRCKVDCIGSSSCRDVRCGPSCACDVTCGIGALCDSLSCRQNCTGSFGGCTSMLTGCNTCL